MACNIYTAQRILYNLAVIGFVIFIIGVILIFVRDYNNTCYYPECVGIVNNTLVNQTCINNDGDTDNCYYVYKTYISSWYSSFCSTEYVSFNYTNALNVYNNNINTLTLYDINDGFCITDCNSYDNIRLISTTIMGIGLGIFCINMFTTATINICYNVRG
jgi:hypothetical protein